MIPTHPSRPARTHAVVTRTPRGPPMAGVVNTYARQPYTKRHTSSSYRYPSPRSRRVSSVARPSFSRVYEPLLRCRPLACKQRTLVFGGLLAAPRPCRSARNGRATVYRKNAACFRTGGDRNGRVTSVTLRVIIIFGLGVWYYIMYKTYSLRVRR